MHQAKQRLDTLPLLSLPRGLQREELPSDQFGHEQACIIAHVRELFTEFVKEALSRHVRPFDEAADQLRRDVRAPDGAMLGEDRAQLAKTAFSEPLGRLSDTLRADVRRQDRDAQSSCTISH
ncbi:hypothetical protein ASF75_00040 [Curtobacterium sp. Leaf154]|nr:hypothetical protein ASF75_00040 [Curtobacterium sp. Leaf154]